VRWLLLFIPFTVQAELCRVDWTNTYRNVANEVLAAEDINHRLFIGEVLLVETYGSATRHLWEQEVCPKCEDMYLTTIEGVNESTRVRGCADPLPPIIN